MTKEEIQDKLDLFHGTEEYFRHTVIGSGSGLLLTDGTNFLRKEAKCHWLFDEIYFAMMKIRNEDFLSFNMEVSDSSSAQIKIDDGNGNILYEKDILFTDFPLDKINLFIIDQRRGLNTNIVVMLPREY